MRERLPYLAFGLAATLGLYIVFGIPLGATAFVIFLAWPILGTLLTADDDLPGGWSNPNGTIRPPWKRAFYWGHIAMGAAITFAALAIDAGWVNPLAALLWVFAAGASALSFMLLRSSSRARGSHDS